MYRNILIFVESGIKFIQKVKMASRWFEASSLIGIVNIPSHTLNLLRYKTKGNSISLVHC